MAKPTNPDAGPTTTTITATTHLDLPAHPVPLTYDQLNPKSLPHEFFGPIGTGLITTTAPMVAYALFFACNEATGCPPTSSLGWAEAWANVGGYPSIAGKLWEWKAAGVYLTWYAFCVACWYLLPGERPEGNLLRDGKRKTYKMNGTSYGVRR
jgi:delta14-sterol reductase